MRNHEFVPSDYRYTIALPKTRHYALGGPLEGKFQALVDQYHASDPYRAGYLNALLMQVLIDIHRGTDEDMPIDGGNRTLKLIRYQEENMCEPFDARAVAGRWALVTST